jgi:hypothetical protein
MIGQGYLGVRQVPVADIVGTLDRSNSFDADFRPLLPSGRARLDSIARAFPDGTFPPINVMEFGGKYFVVDGHHRVRLARERGMDVLDAEITRISTPFELPAGVDLPTLIHTQQRQIFLRDSGLARARPQADITFSRPQGYPELLEVVRSSAYAASLRRGRLVDPIEAAGEWYDHDYLPGVQALRRQGLHRLYEYKTNADLWLWVHQLQRRLLAEGQHPGYDEAVGLALGARISRGFRRRFLRERSFPLRPGSRSTRS